MDRLTSIVLQAEVDVEDTQASLGHRLEEAEDRRARCLVALCERTEADGISALCQSSQLVGEGNMIPRDALGDLIRGASRSREGDLYRAGGVVRLL